MPKIVSNASPLIHLAKIGQVNWLHEFFGEIVIPRAVYQECITEGEGRKEIALIKSINWLQVDNVTDYRTCDCASIRFR